MDKVDRELGEEPMGAAKIGREMAYRVATAWVPLRDAPIAGKIWQELKNIQLPTT